MKQFVLRGGWVSAGTMETDLLCCALNPAASSTEVQQAGTHPNERTFTQSVKIEEKGRAVGKEPVLHTVLCQVWSSALPSLDCILELMMSQRHWSF